MQMEYLAIHAEMTSHHQEGDGLGRTAGLRRRQSMPVASRLPDHLLRLGMPALLLRYTRQLTLHLP